jgi:hypothetical protein
LGIDFALFPIAPLIFNRQTLSQNYEIVVILYLIKGTSHLIHSALVVVQLFQLFFSLGTGPDRPDTRVDTVWGFSEPCAPGSESGAGLVTHGMTKRQLPNNSKIS